jgi:hypothetical protein
VWACERQTDDTWPHAGYGIGSPKMPSVTHTAEDCHTSSVPAVLIYRTIPSPARPAAPIRTDPTRNRLECISKTNNALDDTHAGFYRERNGQTHRTRANNEFAPAITVPLPAVVPRTAPHFAEGFALPVHLVSLRRTQKASGRRFSLTHPTCGLPLWKSPLCSPILAADYREGFLASPTAGIWFPVAVVVGHFAQRLPHSEFRREPIMGQ